MRLRRKRPSIVRWLGARLNATIMRLLERALRADDDQRPTDER